MANRKARRAKAAMERKRRAPAPRIEASKQDKPTEFRAAAGVAATFEAAEPSEDGKPKLAKFSMHAYTGAPMRPQGWWTPIIVDLEGVKISSQHRPILRQHDHEKIVGHSTEIKVDSTGIHVKGTVSNPNAEWSKEIIDTSKNSFQWQASIGANPIRTEFLESGESTEVNGRKVTGPLTISRETELGEISFVPLGADGETSASVTASAWRDTVNPKQALKFSMSLMKAAKYSDEEVDAMTDDEAKAALKKCMKSADDEPDEDDKDKDKKADASRLSALTAALNDAANAAVAKTRSDAAAEINRQSAIQAACKEYGVVEIEIQEGTSTRRVNLAAHGIEKNWTADKVTLEALKASRPGSGVGVVPGGHFHVGSDPVMNGQVLECAVFDALRGSFKLFDDDFYAHGDGGNRRISASEQRRIQSELNNRYPDQIRQAAHTHFKGQIGLKQMLAICARGAGYRGPDNFGAGEWSEVAGYLAESSRPQHIRADGPSSVNAPATLSNVQNKFVLQGYMYTEQSFMDIVSILPVKDLKPTKSVQLFGDFEFKQLNPGGEIQHASMGDNPYANQAKIIARMITLELQYILNDDLGMFGQVPMMLGRGWGLKVNKAVWTTALNPGTDDGGSTDFYAATHTIPGQSGNSNYSSGGGSTLTSAGLQAAKLLFDRQVDPAGNKLGVDAEILLYPPELDVAALELMNAQFIVMAGLASTAAASKQPNTNIWKGRFKPVMSRYLSDSTYTGYSTTAWYLLANPNIIPVIQIAALNGSMTPVIQTAGNDWQFNQLGISMRAWGGMDANKQNFRGIVKSAGA